MPDFPIWIDDGYLFLASDTTEARLYLETARPEDVRDLIRNFAEAHGGNPVDLLDCVLAAIKSGEGTMQAILTLHLSKGEELHKIDYSSIIEAIGDQSLARLIDEEGYLCALYIGDQRITGKPITSYADMCSTLASNATTILHGYRGSR